MSVFARPCDFLVAFGSRAAPAEHQTQILPKRRRRAGTLWRARGWGCRAVSELAQVASDTLSTVVHLTLLMP
eukprot:scaffold25721_cov63-Phaeocystis_antarctica.AAC.8